MNSALAADISLLGDLGVLFDLGFWTLAGAAALRLAILLKFYNPCIVQSVAMGPSVALNNRCTIVLTIYCALGYNGSVCRSTKVVVQTCLSCIFHALHSQGHMYTQTIGGFLQRHLSIADTIHRVLRWTF